MVGVCLHQPNYLPWTKLLAKIAMSDVYVAYDSVQFTRSEYRNRQRLRACGGSVLLSVPVRNARRRQRLCDVRLDPARDWRGYHGGQDTCWSTTRTDFIQHRMAPGRRCVRSVALTIRARSSR